MENQKHKKETDYCERSRKDELFCVSLIKERKVYQPLLRIWNGILLQKITERQRYNEDDDYRQKKTGKDLQNGRRLYLHTCLVCKMSILSRGHGTLTKENS